MIVDTLTLWTIYDHPRDFPRHYVVRGFDILPGGERARPIVCLYDSLTDARHDCHAHGASGFFSPSPDDDPVILETWI